MACRLKKKYKPQHGANEWIVTIDDDYVRNATKLALARTIIHESIHAFIGYILKEGKTSDMYSDLSKLYFEYAKRGSFDDNLSHHQFMSQYVDALANSLSVWDNRQQSVDYYKKLAWGGLEALDAYKSKSQTDKDEIQKVIVAEQTSNGNAKGTKCH